jgi:signal transduction histidine kinase
LERSYEDLKELDKLKSEFVATASHELRSPLGDIKGYLEVVKDGILGEVNEAQEERLAKALAHIDELTSLTNDLLDLSRIEAKKWKIVKKPLVLAEVVTSVLAKVESKAKEKKQDISIDIPSKFPKIRADKESLTRVLVNLLDNAVKFTPEEGQIAVHALDEKENIRIVVEDNGIGIPREHLPRIFDRFFAVESSLTRKLAGVGLGLSIAKGIVEAHGGEIWAESTPGEGTKVHFTLPK